MSLPTFYYNGHFKDSIELDETTSRHIISVLRMKAGDTLWITDGKGTRYTASILSNSKKVSTIKIESTGVYEPPQRQSSIAISLLKNANRFEWFLEKATEIGVKQIIPLLCERTEKQSFRYDRMQQIVISAMLQSQQFHLPVLQHPTNFALFLDQDHDGSKFIAHCSTDEEKPELRHHAQSNSLILIGPEGDFTSKEVLLAKERGFRAVSLGKTRLRTETAGIAALLWCSD